MYYYQMFKYVESINVLMYYCINDTPVLPKSG